MAVIRLGLQRAPRKAHQDFTRDTSFDGCSCRRQNSVDRPLGRGGVLLRKSSAWCGHPWGGADVGGVGEDRLTLPFVDSDDAVGAGCGEVLGTVEQCGRGPQRVARRIGDDRTFTPRRRCLWEKSARLSPTRVALGECSVKQDVIGIGFPQDPQQSGRRVGKVADDGGDVGVGGAEAGDLHMRVMSAEVEMRVTRARW